MKKYKEIGQLYKYCTKIGIVCTMEKLYDGYKIFFPKSKGDFVQHRGSYGADYGRIEPAIGCRLDYSAVSLKRAKALVKYHKAKLNGERK